jgi:hypothetical protein
MLNYVSKTIALEHKIQIRCRMQNQTYQARETCVAGNRHRSQHHSLPAVDAWPYAVVVEEPASLMTWLEHTRSCRRIRFRMNQCCMRSKCSPCLCIRRRRTWQRRKAEDHILPDRNQEPETAPVHHNHSYP